MVAIALAAGLAPTARAGLPETPRLRQLTVRDGLPSNRINGMAEDRAGYLWIATSDGLARYDGVDFRTWRVEQGLHDNVVWAVHVDAANRVWFGTHQAGLGVFDAQRRQFRYYHRGNTPAMASDDVSAVVSTADGAIWFGTTEAGLYRIAADGKSVSRFMPRARDPRSLPSASVRALAMAPDGTLWIGTQGGVARWTGRDFERLPADALNSSVVNSLTVERDGRLWIGTPGGVSLRRPDGSYARSPWGDAGATKVRRVLSRDRSGQYWLDIPAGLGMGGDGETVPLYSAAANGLVSPSWVGAHEDREGGLWFLSSDNGLWYLPTNWRRFSVLSQRADAADSIANAQVRGIAPAADGGMWLVGSGSTLDRLNPETGKAVHVARDVGNGYGLSGVFEDRRGHVWTSWQLGLARVEPASGAITRWSDGDAHDASLFGEARFAQTGDGIVWIATERGVQLRDENDGRVLRTLSPGQAGLPADLYIEQIGRGPDGALWLADAQGLLTWNAGTKRFQSIPGAPQRPVYGFVQAAKDRVWLARFGAVESYRWDGATLTLETAIDTRDGFPALEPNGLALDLSGCLWLTSVRGLIRLDPGKRSVRIYGAHDGLPGQEFETAPVMRPGDGRILAGLNEGLVIFDPMAVKEGGTPPRLVIESVAALDGDDTEAFAPQSQIQIAPDARDIRFVARLLSFDDAHNHRYRFRLGGYDNGWVETGHSGERVFSRLKPGSYRLDVQARTADNLWSPVQTIAFQVLPPWWRTWWAGAIFVLAGAGLLGFVANAYRQRLKRRHSWQLAQQKRELAEQASDAKTRFLAMLGHEVRTPMTGVLGMSELLLGTSLNPQQRGYVGAIRGAGEHLLRLVNDALDLARIDSGKLELADEAFDLHALMEELAALTGPLARQRGLGFAMTIAEEAPRHLRGDAARVRQILLNLLGNAVKFTEQGRVTLGVTRSAQEGVCFEVTDTGPGLNAEQKSRLFRRFEQADGARTRARYGGSGLGLAISQELAAAMRGRIEIDSAPGEGTRFRVDLPLPTTVAVAVSAREEGQAHATGLRRSLSLLLVEDDPTIAEVLTGMLRLQGHHVVHVAHGLAALTAAVTIPFDAALLDLDLPGMDGLALARQLRIQGFAAPLIAVTARADAGAEPDAFDAGFDYFIRKPMTLAMLSALLERAVPGHARAAGETQLDPAQPVAF
ncbi:ATP-binding protein [Lysobacter terrae]